MRVSALRRSAAVAGLACSLCLACGGSAPEPAWVPLARGFQAQPLLPLAQRWQREAGLDPANCVAESTFVRVRQDLPRAVWQQAGTDTWTTPFPGGAFYFGAPSFLGLRSETLPLAFAPDARELEPNRFRLADGRLELRLADGTEPPEDLFLTQRMESGRLPADGVWQVRFGDLYGAGIVVWSGLREELTFAVPAESRLCFELRYLTRGTGPVTLRVELDGEPLLESVADARTLYAEGQRHSIPLPDDARPAARLAFEIEGPSGQGLLLHPVIGPREVGSYGARPWKPARPDIVLFLADTFRADGLALGGGPPELAPALNAFAQEALRFRNARSNTSWTLPSISTLLTGLAPGQHTANDMEHALPDELPTLAEALARAGYRTCAVTDAAFFAPAFGLEQGFESFVLHSPADWDLDWTVQRALEFLEEDDGRPLFLLVHTYRTHMPFRTGPDEDIGPWKELLASGCTLLKTKGKLPREEWVTRLEGCRARYQELYRAGVRDLDRGFGELLAALEARGLARAFVLFTSDHGEALGENEDIFHDGKLWESKLRIPLLVRGPDVVPREVEVVVTLLDLAPTLAEIAGLPRDPAWPGESLFSIARDRPACAFLLKTKTPEVTVLEGGRKLFARDSGALAQGVFAAAFDLARDPHEEHPVTDEAWPAELARRHAALVRTLLVPAGRAAPVPLTGAQQQELGQLGYGGGDEEQ